MQPVEFPGSTYIRSDDEHDIGIYVDRGVDDFKQPFFITAWKPSYEDLQAFNRGEPVYVKVVGNYFPAMILFTTDETGHHNDSN